MKPNILLIIHYTSTSNSFSTPITNSIPDHQSFFFKVYEVVHQQHKNLNPFMNDENLPLKQNDYIDKYNMGYHLEGVYNEEGILHLSSVYYNGLTQYNDNSKSEHIKLCMIQYNINITLILEYDRYCIILDYLYQLCDIK